MTWHPTHCCTLCQMRPGQHGPRCINLPTGAEGIGTAAPAARLKKVMPDTVLCRRKAMPLRAASGAGPPDADSVRALLAAGDVRLTDCNLPDGLEERAHNMAEYFDACVRYEYLASFFKRMPRQVLAHKLCDLAFAFVTHNRNECVRFLPEDPAEFVYYYDRGVLLGLNRESSQLLID